jgi:hypothetical protein
MKKAKLDPSEIRKLHFDVLEKLRDHKWPKILPSQLERSITRNTVAPIIKDHILNIGANTLVVRHDGHLAPRAIIRHGMSFAPDLDISRLNQRCLAIEVKILRPNDASGSLSKAIGQTLAYKALGYEGTIGLILDGRGTSRPGLQELIESFGDKDKLISFVYVN